MTRENVLRALRAAGIGGGSPSEEDQVVSTQIRDTPKTAAEGIYIYGSPPPQGLPEREGVYHLPSVVLNTFKDMLRKHCKFQCFMHILLVLF